MKVFKIKYLFAVLAMALAFGCKPENNPLCGPLETVTVRFTYTLKDISLLGVNPDQVESITLYVFDSEGRYVKSINEENINFNRDYTMQFSLAQGEYKFVAWGNLSAPYFITPPVLSEMETNIDQAQLYLKRPLSGVITGIIPHLFYFRLTSATIAKGKDNTIVVPTLQISNSITLRAVGLYPSADDYEFSITDTNSKYDFYGNFAQDAELKYISILSKSAVNAHTGNTTVLKLADHREVTLEVFNFSRQKTVYRGNLIELLKKLEDVSGSVDWEGTHDYTITLTINIDLTITININGWNVVTENQQLP